MRQPRKMPQRVQIRKFGKIVLRQDEAGKIRYRGRKRGLYARDAIAGEEEGV